MDLLVFQCATNDLEVLFCYLFHIWCLMIFYRAKFKNIEETEKAKQDLMEDMKTK